MNLPTKISFSRIIATVLLIIALFVMSLIIFEAPTLRSTGINLVFLIIFIFFLIASYTDHLDGHLARKNNQITNLGKFLDPVAIILENVIFVGRFIIHLLMSIRSYKPCFV